MHQIRTAHAAAEGHRAGHGPRRFNAILARFKNLDDFARPEAFVAVVRLIECDTHQLAGQGETHEHHTPVDMSHTTPLIGITLNANLGLHKTCASLPCAVGAVSTI